MPSSLFSLSRNNWFNPTELLSPEGENASIPTKTDASRASVKTDCDKTGPVVFGLLI
jgi:hypothetical protein